MSTWIILCLLVVVNSAIWVFFDASRLRDSRHTGVGPMEIPPQTWAAMTFLFWPLALPYYLKKRPLAEELEERSGPPPRFVTEGLTAMALIFGLIGFLIFGGFLTIGELKLSILGLVVAAAGIFGGRKTHMTREQEQVTLGSLAIEQVGFSAPNPDDFPEPDEEPPANLDQYFASMSKPGSASRAPAASPPSNTDPGKDSPPAGVPYSPTLPSSAQEPPPGVPYAPTFNAPPPPPLPPSPQPSSSAHTVAQPPATQPPVSQPSVRQSPVHQPSVNQLPANPPPSVTPEAPPPGTPYSPQPFKAGSLSNDQQVPPPPIDPKATIAMAPDVAKRHVAGPSRPAVSVPPVSSSPSVQVPRNLPTAESVSSAPARSQEPTPQQPLPSPPRRRTAPKPPPRQNHPSGKAGRSGTARPVGSYAYAANASSSTVIIRSLAAGVALIALVALGWFVWTRFIADASTPIETASAAEPELEPSLAETETASASKIPEEPSEISKVAPAIKSNIIDPATMTPWTDAYTQWMAPVATHLDEIDFEGFSAERCKNLRRALRAARPKLGNCPDSDVGALIKSALPIFKSAVVACENREKNRWSTSLLEAKRLVHDAQVLLDQRYRFAGISELELESAIDVQRSTESISGRWLVQQEESTSDDFADDGLDDGILDDDIENEDFDGEYSEEDLSGDEEGFD